MPLIAPIQPSMAGGEYSPSIYSRVDLEKYKSGLRTAYNFIIHPQGGASNRCGFEYIASTKYPDSMSIAQEFIFSQTQAYVLEFGHLYVRFYTNGAQLTNGGTSYEVATPYTESDLSLLRFETSADVIFITHPNYQQRTLTRFGGTDWVLDTIDYEDGPFMPENTSDSTSLTISAVSGASATLTVSSTSSIDSTITALFHFNGPGFIEETGRIVTTYGDAQISMSQYVFGGASALFDGTGDAISVPDSNDFNFGAGSATIAKFRMYPFSVAGGILVGQWETGSVNAWAVQMISGKISFQYRSGATVESVTFNKTLVVNTWYDVMVIQVGGIVKCSINGLFEANTLTPAVALPNVSAVLSIGGRVISGVVDVEYTGYIDELIIKKGTVIHSSNFTVENTPYSYLSVNSNFFFSPYHVGALFKLRHYVQGQTSSTVFTSATTGTSIKCFTTWRLITHGTWTGKLRVEKSIDGGSTWTVLRSFSSTNDSNFDTSGTEDVETNPVPFLVRMNMYAFTSGTATVDLTTDAFYQEGIVKVTSYLSATAVMVQVLNEVGATTATTSWSEGSFSDYRGWPAISRFYKDRLVYASTYSEPQTLWMTVTSNYYSFFVHQTLLDTDAISVPLPSRQLNAINGLVAFKKLLAFTSSSVWSIGPITGNALTPLTVSQDIEEYSGSANIAPVVIGTEALFSEFGGEVVRNIGFQLANDGFIGSETNILSKHLFEGYTITKMAYARKPNGVLWCRRSDGLMVALTYLKEQEVVAWSLHETNGDVKDFCVIPGDTSDELWAIVSRDNGMYMERMRGRKQHVLTDHVFLDSYTTALSNTAVISNLNHLANEIVGIIGDDAYLGTYTVSASGTLALSTTYTTSYIGLPYNSDLESLNIEVPLASGTLQGNMIKIGNLTLRLINTRSGKIGPNSDTLYDGLTFDVLNKANYQQKNVALGATENFTGDVRIPLGASYQHGGRLFYRQSDPLPVTICAFIPEFDVGDKKSG